MEAFGIVQSLKSWYGAGIIGLLGLVSVYLVALIILRVKFFRSISIDSDGLLKNLEEAISNKKKKELEELKGKRATDPPLRILV